MRNTFRYSFATVLTAGLVLAPVSAAFADAETDGSGGVGSGNQIIVPADIEANLCGNSLAVLGISEAECTEVSEVLYESSDHDATTDGSGGVASGNQIIVPVDAAVEACGDAVSVGGVSEAECVEVVETLEDEADENTTASTDGSDGVASGNQIIVPVDTAVDICGNSVAILGGSSAKCTTVINIIQAAPENEGADGTEGAAETDGSGGVASGNQVTVPIDAAVDICGNAVSVLGVAEASCMEQISHEDDEEEDGKEEEEEEEGKDDGKEEEEEETGKGDEDEDKDDGKEEDEGGDDAGDEKPVPDNQAGGELPVTGGALGGLVAAALAAVGAGGAGLYFARKRKAAVAIDEE